MKVRCFRRKIFSVLLILVLVVSVASVLDFGFVPSVYATGDSFGYTSIGALITNCPNNELVGLHDAPASSGTVDSISAYIWTDSGTQTFRYALYAYVGAGDAGAWIANTTEGTATTSLQWVTVEFSSPPSVTASTEYFLVIYADGGELLKLNYDSGGAAGIGFYGGTGTYPTFPDPITGESASSSLRSIYANYTISGDDYSWIGDYSGYYNVTAVSGSAADIQAAVDDVEENGTYPTAGEGLVLIPSGNFTWDGGNVTIHSGVNVFGASPAGCKGHTYDWEHYTATTILHNIADSANFETMFRVNDGDDGAGLLSSRVAGIQFELVAPANISEETGKEGYAIGSWCLHDFRIDHCTFINFNDIAVQISSADGREGWYHTYGVIDHCVVDNPYKNTPPPSGEWFWGYGFYSVGNMKPEYSNWNNETLDFAGKYESINGTALMYVEDCYFSDTRHATDAIQGGWNVIRFCKFENADPEYGDICLHGSQTWYAGRGMEIYNNTVYGGTAYLNLGGIRLRGGAAFVFNNTVSYASESELQTLMILDNYDWSETFPFTNINDTYIWDNTNINCTALRVLQGTENVTYYLYEPTLELSGFIYTPYVYPHPLVSGESPTYYYLNITSGTGGTTDPTTGEHEYLDGSYAVVEAFPSAGYSFANWTLDAGDGGTDNPTSIYMTANHTIQPNFDQISYAITLTPNPTFLLQGETVSITVSATKNGEAFTAYIMNVTKDGTLWKQNIVEANSTFTDQSTTATSHTYSVSSLYDSDAGGEVNYSITPLTLYWNVPSATPPAPGTTQPLAETEPEEPTIPEEAEEDVTFLVVGIAAITLIAIGLVFVTSGEEKKLKRWRVQKPKRWRA